MLPHKLHWRSEVLPRFLGPPLRVRSCVPDEYSKNGSTHPSRFARAVPQSLRPCAARPNAAATPAPLRNVEPDRAQSLRFDEARRLRDLICGPAERQQAHTWDDLVEPEL